LRPSSGKVPGVLFDKLFIPRGAAFSTISFFLGRKVIVPPFEPGASPFSFPLCACLQIRDGVSFLWIPFFLATLGDLPFFSSSPQFRLPFLLVRPPLYFSPSVACLIEEIAFLFLPELLGRSRWFPSLFSPVFFAGSADRALCQLNFSLRRGTHFSLPVFSFPRSPSFYSIFLNFPGRVPCRSRRFATPPRAPFSPRHLFPENLFPQIFFFS